MRRKNNPTIRRDSSPAPRHYLRAMRIIRGYDQRGLARAARITQPDISYLEQGRRNPTAEIAEKIAIILGTPAAELFPELKAEEAGAQ